jgi:hypothetical protein
MTAAERRRLQRQLDALLTREAQLASVRRSGCKTDQRNLDLIRKERQRIEARLEAEPERWTPSLDLFPRQ